MVVILLQRVNIEGLMLSMWASEPMPSVKSEAHLILEI